MAIPRSASEHPKYTAKKGIAFGAFAGFVAAIAFTGVVMGLPYLFEMPGGLFMHALGLLVVNSTPSDDPALTGLAGFAIILAHGIIVGIILGWLASISSTLHPSTRAKGVKVGLAAGLVAYLVIYVPVAMTAFPALLSKAVATYPAERLALLGLSDYNMTVKASSYVAGTLGYGLFAYLVFGAILGGIVSLEYSIYHFVAKRHEQIQREELQ